MTGATLHHQEIYQRDDGLWAIGLGEDSLGPFQSRKFAEIVAGLPTTSAPLKSFRRIKIREVPRAGCP
jgi:hypothetical protein